MAYKFFDTQDRKKLNEGRTQGLGFAFCQLKNGNELHTVQPLSCCKDYLSDVVYSERTGKNYEIYGLATKKDGLFEDDKPGYLAIRILPYGTIRQEPYEGMEEDERKLKENHQRMVLFINHYERLLKLPSLTTVEPVDDTTYVLLVPSFWTEFCYRISLYALYIRCSLDWDGKREQEDFLRHVGGDDYFYVTKTMDKVRLMIEKGAPIQDMTGCFNPHNEGIHGFQFP